MRNWNLSLSKYGPEERCYLSKLYCQQMRFAKINNPNALSACLCVCDTKKAASDRPLYKMATLPLGQVAPGCNDEWVMLVCCSFFHTEKHSGIAGQTPVYSSRTPAGSCSYYALRVKSMPAVCSLVPTEALWKVHPGGSVFFQGGQGARVQIRD